MKIAAEPIVPSVDILNSWKEIASYLSRGVRTVQRWEAELGMPVRRPRGRGRSAVIAIRSELDQWIKSCPLEAQQDAESYDGATHDVTWTLSPAVEQLRISTLQLHQLRNKMTDSREQFAAALTELAMSVEKMRKNSWGAPNGDVLARLPEAAMAVSS